MQQFGDIDLDHTPIVVLSCKHFFTAETLDGVVGMKDVYELDPSTGRYTALVEDAKLAASVPLCPACRQPISQYVTQRYNRLINKAVIDEMSTRFFVTGQQEIQRLTEQLKVVIGDLEDKPAGLEHDLKPINDASLADREARKVNAFVRNRYLTSERLERDISAFLRRADKENQPAYKLHEATIYASRRQSELSDSLADLTLRNSPLPRPKPNHDQSVHLGGQLLLLKLHHLILQDRLEIRRAFKSRFPNSASPPAFPDGSPVKMIRPFLVSCTKVLHDCKRANLPKMAVEVVLSYAHITRLRCGVAVGKPGEAARIAAYRESARSHLQDAAELCKLRFSGADDLADAVEDSQRLLGKEFYEEVTKEEIEAIKRAMVDGPRGIATHSGHWYKCQNGHPFGIGECGMPMERARCPQCSATIGGQNHQAVAGVTRALDMED